MTVDDALGLAYRYLNRRERTVAETRAHLESRDVEPGMAEQVMARLTEQGYLDDRRFARLFVQDRRELDQWGEERLRRGLASRGIGRELIEEVIAEAESPGQELERAVALLRRRLPHPEPGRRGRERALGLLLRRGYAYELADQAVRTHAAETRAPRGETSLPAPG